MAKDKPEPTTGKDEDIFGSPGLLDRLGKGKAVIEATRSAKEKGAKVTRGQSAKALKRQRSKESTPEAETVKVSVYLTQNDLDALDQRVISSRRETGRKKDRSELIREAVRLWLKAQR